METTNGTQTTTKKYEPHLDELPTDEQQIERVRELILEADSMDELGEDFERNGVRKPLYFLQIFARESKQPPVERAVVLLREGMEASGTSTLHYHKMREAIELLTDRFNAVRDFAIEVGTLDGWVEIKSEDDLPKEHGWYLVTNGESIELSHRTLDWPLNDEVWMGYAAWQKIAPFSPAPDDGGTNER